MRNHEDVMKNEDEPLKHDWRNDAKISSAYVQKKDEFFENLFDSRSMCDGHMDQNIIGKH